MFNLSVKFRLFASAVLALLLRHNFDLWLSCDLDLGRMNLKLFRDIPSHYVVFFQCSFIKFASVVYVQHNFRHHLTSDLIVTLTLCIGT